jgi:hypothetical protein
MLELNLNSRSRRSLDRTDERSPSRTNEAKPGSHRRASVPIAPTRRRLDRTRARQLHPVPPGPPGAEWSRGPRAAAEKAHLRPPSGGTRLSTVFVERLSPDGTPPVRFYSRRRSRRLEGSSPPLGTRVPGGSPPAGGSHRLSPSARTSISADRTDPAPTAPPSDSSIAPTSDSTIAPTRRSHDRTDQRQHDRTDERQFDRTHEAKPQSHRRASVPIAPTRRSHDRTDQRQHDRSDERGPIAPTRRSLARPDHRQSRPHRPPRVPVPPAARLRFRSASRR